MGSQTHPEPYSDLMAPFEDDIASKASRDAARDRADLRRVGKTPVLKREFGFLTTLSFSCTILLTWEGMLSSFAVGFENGGPSGVVYGYILVWIGSASMYATLGELVSMAPVSSGQYHWVAMLAPGHSKRFLSYITGWLTLCGWQASMASAGILNGNLLQALIILTQPGYEPKAWHPVLLAWAYILFSVIVNITGGGVLPKFEGVVLIIHILGFFGILLPLVVLGPHGDVSSVFSTLTNSGGWSTKGLSFMIGLTGNVYAFVGADAAVHMSEEVHNAASVVPRSILYTLLLNGTLGFGMAIAILFCLGDPDAALMNKYGYPFVEIFRQAVQSTAGAAVMASVVLVLAIGAAPGYLACASRILWAFSRDRAVPGWRFVQRVSPTTSIPVYAVAITTAVSCLLALIQIGSAVVLNIIFSLVVGSLYISYLITCSLLLYRRCTGAILPHAEYEDSASGIANSIDTQLMWGKWRIPGAYGIVNNTFACAYMAVILFFSFWPGDTPVTAGSMNYSSALIGGLIVFSILYYLLWARRDYHGPIVESEGVFAVESERKYSNVPSKHSL